MILEDYGWDSWFDAQYKSLNMHLNVGRVVGNAEIYKVVCEGGVIDAGISHRLFYSTSSDSELPVSGDWVLIISDESESGYSIYDLLPRRSFLVLADQDNPDQQIPAAANVDYILAAIPSGDSSYLSFVENLSDISHDWGAEPLFLFYGKAGNGEKADVEKTAGGAGVIFVDSLDDAGLSGLKELLSPRKTYAVTGVNDRDVLVIINYLIDGKIFDDGEYNRNTADDDTDNDLSKCDLHLLTNSAMLLSTPLPGGIGFYTGIDDHNGNNEGDDFGDIIGIAGLCRFNDCRHINEPGCAVLEALDGGDLDYDHYKKFLKVLRKDAGRIPAAEQGEVKKQKKIIALKSERNPDL